VLLLLLVLPPPLLLLLLPPPLPPPPLLLLVLLGGSWLHAWLQVWVGLGDLKEMRGARAHTGRPARQPGQGLG
jgi:hypothetical protein